jgi:cobalt-zinc-cadmium efflux system outer membrane protein
MMLLWFGIVGAVSASSSHAMTLEEALATALRQNPELQELRLEAESAEAQLDKARLPLIANPVLETSGSRREMDPEEEGGSVTNYGVRLSQEFEVAGQRSIRIEVAQKNLSRVGFEIADRERMLRHEVKEAYATALASKERISLAKEVVKLREDLLDLTRTKYRAGDVSALEVNLAEVEAVKARSELVAAEQSHRDAILSLQGVTGTGIDLLPSVVEGELTPDVIGVPDRQTLRNALRERPDIKAAALEVDRSNRAVDLVRREAIPNPSLGAFYDRDELRSDVGMVLSISIPLFDRKQAERREARARLEQARIKRAGLDLTIEREFDEAYTNLVSSLRQLSLYKKEIVVKSLENLDLLNLAFKEGKIGFYDIRLAQRDAIDVRFAYLDALLRAEQAINNMERTTGGNLR